MRRIIFCAFLLLLGSGVLGATVFQGQLAGAAGQRAARHARVSATPVTVPVREQNLDTNGFIRTHEQGTANVNVTNASVPVSGTVDVGTMPSLKIDPTGNTVNAQQNGTWTVGIDPSANTVQTVAADNPSFQRVQAISQSLPFADGGGQVEDHVYTVPSGKNLVIEQVSFLGHLPNGENFSRVELIPDEDLHIGQYLQPATEVPASATVTAISGSELTRMYAGQDSSVYCAFDRYPATGAGSAVCVISGYLVNAP